MTIQAEDEIAAANMALGAAFTGHLGVTGTSGPGIDLKAETIGLAVITELPMILVDVMRRWPIHRDADEERAGRSVARDVRPPRGIADPDRGSVVAGGLLLRGDGSCSRRDPLPDPVNLLSDSFLQNSSEPWLLPDIDALPTIDPKFAEANGADFLPYARDERLARPWAIPGTPGLEHRIGGLEREDRTGDISYEAENHERMTQIRREKVEGIAADIPPLEVDDPTGDAELLVLGWGSTAGTVRAAVQRVRGSGERVATAHLRWLNPMPTNTGEVVTRYRKILIPELNSGQLTMLIRARFLADAKAFSKVQGLPIWADELEEAIVRMLHG